MYLLALDGCDDSGGAGGVGLLDVGVCGGGGEVGARLLLDDVERGVEGVLVGEGARRVRGVDVERHVGRRQDGHARRRCHRDSGGRRDERGTDPNGDAAGAAGRQGPQGRTGTQLIEFAIWWRIWRSFL